MKILHFTLAASLFAQAAYADTSGNINKKCEFILNGVSIFNSPCAHDYVDSNSIEQFSTQNGEYFLYFIHHGPHKVDAWWNGEPFASHAHDSLGVLIEDGSCWKNDHASLCWN